MGVDVPDFSDLLHLLDREVAHADGANDAALPRRLQAFHPRTQVFPGAGPVDVVQVDHVGLQARAAAVDGVEHRLRRDGVQIGFGGEIEALPATRLRRHEAPDQPLGVAAAVARAGVKVSDAAFQRHRHARQQMSIFLPAPLVGSEGGAAQAQRRVAAKNRHRSVLDGVARRDLRVPVAAILDGALLRCRNQCRSSRSGSRSRMPTRNCPSGSRRNSP